MKNFYLILAAFVALSVSGCTDTFRASVGSYGNQAHVRCWSGGEIIIDDVSTGRVHSPSSSDGWQFMSSETGRLREVSGDCVIDTLAQ